MSRISAVWDKLKERGEKAFIPYLTCGYPSLKTTEVLTLRLEECGADMVELGIPFSDPIADGPTIQFSSQKALEKRVSVRKVLQVVRGIRKKSQIPLLLMSYYNPLLVYPEEEFVVEAKEAGVDGVIVPDLPPEEALRFRKLALQNSLDMIFLVAPTTPLTRVKKIARLSTGFIYYVSLTGVTGARDALPPELREEVLRVKSLTRKPVAVGFGISREKQARQIATFADGLIIGSAIIQLIKESPTEMALLHKVTNFAKKIKKSLKGY